MARCICVQRGLTLLEEASTGEWLTEYHVEAAIASVHALSKCFEETNWRELIKLYDALESVKPGPTTALNKAIAIGYGIAPEAGIEALAQLPLANSHYYHAAFGNFYCLLNDLENAKSSFEKALNLAHSSVEKDLLQRKLNSIG